MDHYKRIFMKIVEDVSNVKYGIALQLTINAMNDTMGPEGLVPFILVFRTLPRFWLHYSKISNHRDRMESMNVVHVEMADVVSEQKVKIVVKSKIRPANTYEVLFCNVSTPYNTRLLSYLALLRCAVIS